MAPESTVICWVWRNRLTPPSAQRQGQPQYGQRVDAVSEGSYIEAGTEVVVTGFPAAASSHRKLKELNALPVIFVFVVVTPSPCPLVILQLCARRPLDFFHGCRGQGGSL